MTILSKLNRVVEDQTSGDMVAYVDIYDASDPDRTIKTVCLNYENKEQFKTALSGKIDRVETDNSARINAETRVKEAINELESEKKDQNKGAM